MSCLKALSVGLAVLSLCRSVLSVSPFKSDYNARMNQCIYQNMTPVQDLDLDSIQGLWYVSHFSSPAGGSHQLTGAKCTITQAITPNGETKQDFVVIVPTASYTTGYACDSDTWLFRGNGGTWSYGFFPYYIPSPRQRGYYVGWWDRYVLATDYSTTAVMLVGYVFSGSLSLTWSEIQVLVRDATAAPNATVVDQALNGFCSGDFLDLSSDYYLTIPNDSNLPCFTG